MKRKILVFIILLFSFQNTFAYELSQKDKESLLKVKDLLWNLSSKKDKSWFDDKIIKIDKLQYNYKNNIRFWLVFNELKNELQNISNSFIISENSNINYKTIFFNENSKGIINGMKLREGCTKYFDFIDEIAKKNDFPTALIIATWSKEFNCQLSNPANGWGPFQITSQYYEPGEITLDDFAISVQNFIDFSKGKWNYFDTNSDYKNRFGEEKINLTYEYYNLRDLRLHSVLYNGIRKTTNLESNEFANGNLNKDIITDTDGIVTLFLKVLNWQIENNK